jgi:1-acyl-sn-glycerol-3-phosphate acyltransferase
MATMARVTVNILNTNELRFLPRCVDAVLNQTFTDFECVVIDNASTDGSPEWVETHRPNVRIIRNKTNRWYCGGHNIGIRETGSELLLLLNSDVFIEPDFLERMVRAIDADERLGGVQGKLWKILDPAGDPPSPSERHIDTTGILMTRSRRNFDRFQEAFDNGAFDEPGPVFGPDGSAPLYRRSMLEDIAIDGEYFDESFKIYRDVVDISWRARSRGWTFAYVPDATGFHVRGFSPRKRKKQPLFFRRLSYRNRYLTLLKNEQFRSLLPHLPEFLGFEILMLGHVLFREPSLTVAWIDLLKLFPEALGKRRSIMARATVPAVDITRDFAEQAPALHHRKKTGSPDSGLTASGRTRASLFRTLTGWGLSIPVTFLIALTVLIWSTITRKGEIVHRGARLWGRTLLRLCGIRVVVNGLENVPAGASPMLIVANHQSMFDIFAFEGFFPVPFAWIAKKSLFRIPLVGAAMLRAGYIPVDRNDQDSAKQSLQKAAKHLQSHSIVIFPEGTRSRTGLVGRFKKGALFLAAASHVPILPVTITGSWQRLPPEHWIVSPGILTIHIDPPVITAGKTRGELEEEISIIRNRMVQRVDASQ